MHLKKTLPGTFAILALFTLTACPPKEPQRGTPIGTPAVATIGNAGGSLTSSDGRLTVEIPQGALAADTEISIQPLENVAPHSVGRAYRLGPENVTFDHPVQLTLSYEGVDLGEKAPQGLAVAFQGEDGRWLAPLERDLDPEARAVTVLTDHFSDWTLFELLSITPKSGSVEEGQTLELEVKTCAREVDELFAWLIPVDTECRVFTDTELISGWSVNGVEGGSPETGAVQGQGGKATFTAPTHAPSVNPVAVSVGVRLKPSASRFILVSNLRIGGPCPMGICRFTGTLSDHVDGDAAVTTQAALTFTFDTLSEDGYTARYLPSGTIAVEVTLPNDACTMELSPSEHEVGPQHGHLELNLAADPVSYFARDMAVEWDAVQTWTCPEGDPWQDFGAMAYWGFPSGVLSEDGSIEGNLDDDQRVTTWRFQPE